MKKIISMIFVILIATSLFAVPSDDVIQNAANELGVPFDDLKAYVSSFYTSDEPADDVLVVDPNKYYQEYETNKILFDKKYEEGKTLRMTITFKEIGDALPRNSSKYAAISEEGPWWGLSFGLLPEYVDVLSTLKPGQRIIVEGVSTGFVSYINDCRIVQILD